MERDRIFKLAATAVAAGAFSGLFGVGGGTVIVPLLVIWLGFGEREATATSLGAIVIIAAAAAGGHALYGNVEAGKALLIGAPALVGVLGGVALQQRLPERVVSLAFAALLAAGGVELLVG